MNILINYVDFHWDNYQGGSGKFLKLSYCLNLPSDLKCFEISEFISNNLSERVETERSFKQNNRAIITNIEVLWANQ